MHTLEGPGVAVRPSQLACDWLCRCAFGGLEELIETRQAKRTRRLELGQHVPETPERRMRRVVIGPDEHRNMFARRAWDERRADVGPDVGETRAPAR